LLTWHKVIHWAWEDAAKVVLGCYDETGMGLCSSGRECAVGIPMATYVVWKNIVK